MDPRPEVRNLPIDSLLPAVRNPRTHSKKQLRKLADAIARFNVINPILIRGEPARIVAGHGRWLAAKLLKRESVPTQRVDHLSDDEAKAYALADNQIATLAGWDRELLALELTEIETLMPTLDLRVTGFEIEEIEILRDTASSKRPLNDVAEIPPVVGPAVTRAGDVWSIGAHRLLCGDALEPGNYDQLLQGDRADIVISDMPFNVPIAGHVTSKAHREFAMASGEMSRSEFQRFLSRACSCLAAYSRSGSLHYLFMDWRSIADLIGAGEEHYGELLNIIVWVKPQGGMGSFLRSRHELIALFRNGSRTHINNVALGKHGRNRSNVWEYPGANGFGPEREWAKVHPTVKNIDLIADAIRDASDAGNIVLDPFGGSGTTLVAAHRTNRRARLIELDPLYCDVCIRRAEQEKLTITLEATGACFNAVMAERLNKPPVGDRS